MTRIALGIEYNGTHYRGWQTQQAGVPTVQSQVERALALVANHPVSVICAGRTDAGVHGCGQVVHFDSDADRQMRAWQYGGNSNLPPDISIRWAVPVAGDFHARFSAFSRRYRYVIYNHPIRPALLAGQVSWQFRPLDVPLMQRAARYLVGEHDFSSFRGIYCQSKTPVKTIHSLELYQRGKLIVLEVEANAFLMHMVRNIAGALMAVGVGRYPVDWVQQVLAAKNRSANAATAPPDGLYLVGVGYPERFDLPSEPYGPAWLPEDLCSLKAID
ncbi:MAG: tRNA pseudouridine(38-40) synthase TruA [Gammaproteobacteria bacterium HGW-Gammaproteobacteria-14]|nr:MAG: tRNA pseudouridine(38-40) synthase TruA [Gammaproteobacteria bacterium HGW-Gammaproteobacteria-14]